jgi:hypothetical protein
MADAAFHFHADDFQFRILNESCREGLERLRDGVELGAALAANGDDDFSHRRETRCADSNGCAGEISLRNCAAEENSGGHFHGAHAFRGKRWACQEKLRATRGMVLRLAFIDPDHGMITNGVKHAKASKVWIRAWDSHWADATRSPEGA